MSEINVDVQTGSVNIVAFTAEQQAEFNEKRTAFERDVLPGILRKQIEESRASAYRSEADPLFFKAQRGEATMDEWNAKVAEIRARYPYGGE